MIDQRGVPRTCRASPALRPVSRSSSAAATTRSTTCTASRGSRRAGTSASPAPAPSARSRSTGPEVMVPVRCDVHPWMRLDLGVVAHPYFAVTGDDGQLPLRRRPGRDVHARRLAPEARTPGAARSRSRAADGEPRQLLLHEPPALALRLDTPCALPTLARFRARLATHNRQQEGTTNAPSGSRDRRSECCFARSSRPSTSGCSCN